MLWPFNHFREPRRTLGSTIEAIYGMIVTQARESIFYRDLSDQHQGSDQGLGVPDTVEGRFDLLLLHLWLVLRRLRSTQDGPALSQALFDRFCEDMDDNLRELGVGDLAVPKRMRAFGEAFYGRARAYDRAMDDGGDVLASAICRNILNGAGTEQARRLAAYARASEADLGRTDDGALLRASFRFPSPLREDLAP